MNESLTVQAIIFDMDGVLTDSEPLINAAAVAMFQEKGLQVQSEDFSSFVGTGEDNYLGGVAAKYRFSLDLAAAKKRTYELYLELVPARLNAFPGAVELVRACRRAGLKVAVASSADRIKIDANLRKIGLPPETWDAIVTAEDAVNKKPAPDLFLAAAQRLGLTSKLCVVIEDAIVGVQAAKSAGMRCVAVAQTFPQERLQDAEVVKAGISEVSVADLVGEPDGAAPQIPPLPRAGPLPDGGAGGQPAPARPWGFWATLGFGLLVTLAFLAAGQLALVAFFVLAPLLGIEVAPATLGTNGFLWALSAGISSPVMIAFTVFFAWLRKRMSVREYLAFRRPRVRDLSIFCVVLLAWLLVSDQLAVLLGQPVVPDVMIQVYRTAYLPPLLWMALIVGAPLSEEIFFRGFLFKGMAHSPLGAVGAILLTSLLWSVVHLQYNIFGIAIIFLTGLLFGYARWKTDSVLPGIVMHAIMNGLATWQVSTLT